MFTTNKQLVQTNIRALLPRSVEPMGRNSRYYGIRFDRRLQNFGFHMIAQSQLIANDRSGVFPCDRLRPQNLLRSAIRNRLRSYVNQPLLVSDDPLRLIHTVHVQGGDDSLSARLFFANK